MIKENPKTILAVVATLWWRGLRASLRKDALTKSDRDIDLYPTLFRETDGYFHDSRGGRGGAPLPGQGASAPLGPLPGDFAPRTPLKILNQGFCLGRACHQLSSVKTTFLYGTAVLFTHFIQYIYRTNFFNHFVLSLFECLRNLERLRKNYPDLTRVKLIRVVTFSKVTKSVKKKFIQNLHVQNTFLDILYRLV